ncbi:MAG: acetylornithine deacetylase [Mesorhizobium amorphae]|nr:MAG: acetylornithine deacetylase [Mesorhizobium amorphae]
MSERMEAILAAVDEGFARQVAFLEALVRHPSQRNAEAELQDFVQSELERRGFAVDRFRTQGPADNAHPAFSPATVPYDESWNLVATRKGAGHGRSLALNAHVDVVPPGPLARWTTPPYEPRRNGDWLYGRGAGDMKAGLAAAVFALDAITQAGLALSGPVQVQSVVDEEMTGNGAATVLSRGYRADAIVIAEPTDGRLVRANSGVLKFAVTLQGVPTHPREPEAGRSAIDLAIALIAHLRRLEASWVAEKENHALFAGIANPVSLTVGTIQGGEWLASFPSECRFEGRIGFYPGEEPKARMRAFEAFVLSAVADDPMFEGVSPPMVEWVGVTHAGYSLAPGSDAEACLARAHMQASGRALESYVMTAYLDAAVFAVHAGMPALVYGPVAENIHAIDERVSLSSLKAVTKTIALFAADWCGVERA